MLPACCPKCGANLASGMDTRERAQDARRVTSSYAAQGQGIPRRSGGGNILRALVAILLVGIAGAIVSFVLYQSEMWGGRSIPDVSGMRVERATQELEAVGLSASVETVRDDGQAGLVLEMSPAAGERVADGTQVRLVVSQQRVMPAVVGKTREEARQLMETEGIPCEFVDEVSDETAETVLSATSPEGTALTSQALVTIHVAVPRTVPDLAGFDEDDARTRLTDLGVTVKVTYVESSNPADDGKVVGTNPSAGSAVRKGDTVELKVSRARVEALKKIGEEIVRAIYDCPDPLAGDAPIGAALRPYVDPAMRVSGETTAKDATNYQLWYGVVKHWKKLSAGAPEGLDALPRSIVSIDSIQATKEGHVTVAVTVRWDWSALGAGYGGVTSTDAHYISMDFNDQDLLTAFWDEQTDVPLYEVVTTPDTGADTAGDTNSDDSTKNN